VPVVVPVEQRKWVNFSELSRNRKSPQAPGVSAIMPTDHSLPALRRSASQAGRRRFDPGRPLSSNRTIGHAFQCLPRNRARGRPAFETGRQKQSRGRRRRADLHSSRRATKMGVHCAADAARFSPASTKPSPAGWQRRRGIRPGYRSWAGLNRRPSGDRPRLHAPRPVAGGGRGGPGRAPPRRTRRPSLGADPHRSGSG
jgi:hypothetical protein